MTNAEIYNRAKEVIKTMPIKTKLTVYNVVTQSLFSAGGTLANTDTYWISRAINAEISKRELEDKIKRKFVHLSNEQLISRINQLPDFKWNDEGAEIVRRKEESNGKFDFEMQGNKLVILKDE
jgi:hypothetical protein